MMKAIEWALAAAILYSLTFFGALELAKALAERAPV